METVSLIDTYTPLLTTLLVIFVIIIGIKVFTLPISIAKNKNLTRNEMSTIRILTWFGLLAGITWVIALCLALSYKDNKPNH